MTSSKLTSCKGYISRRSRMNLRFIITLQTGITDLNKFAILILRADFEKYWHHCSSVLSLISEYIIQW